MNVRDEQFLNLKHLPARLRAEEVALLLGFSVQEIPILVASGLMKPLGHPPITGVKYFSIVELEEFRNDPKWLARASDCIVQYWKNTNQNRKSSKLPIRRDRTQFRRIPKSRFPLREQLEEAAGG
jgi:hypothetical protein